MTNVETLLKAQGISFTSEPTGTGYLLNDMFSGIRIQVTAQGYFCAPCDPLAGAYRPGTGDIRKDCNQTLAAVRRAGKTLAGNDWCPCGSGRIFKSCHGEFGSDDRGSLGPSIPRGPRTPPSKSDRS